MRFAAILFYNGAAFSPDTHLLRGLNQFISEIRMRDGNKQLRSFPGCLALQIDSAVLG